MSSLSPQEISFVVIVSKSSTVILLELYGSFAAARPGNGGAGGYIAVGTEIFRHGIDLSGIQRNAVNTSFYAQIKTISVGRNVGNRIYVFFQQLVILFGIHKQTFFHAGYRSVKIIQWPRRTLLRGLPGSCNRQIRKYMFPFSSILIIWMSFWP